MVNGQQTGARGGADTHQNTSQTQQECNREIVTDLHNLLQLVLLNIIIESVLVQIRSVLRRNTHDAEQSNNIV